QPLLFLSLSALLLLGLSFGIAALLFGLPSLLVRGLSFCIAPLVLGLASLFLIVILPLSSLSLLLIVALSPVFLHLSPPTGAGLGGRGDAHCQKAYDREGK